MEKRKNLKSTLTMTTTRPLSKYFFHINSTYIHVTYSEEAAEVLSTTISEGRCVDTASQCVTNATISPTMSAMRRTTPSK